LSPGHLLGPGKSTVEVSTRTGSLRCRYVRAITDKCGTTIDVRCYGTGCVLRPSLLLEAFTIGRLRHCLWMARGQYRRGGAWPRWSDRAYLRWGSPLSTPEANFMGEREGD